MPTGPPEIVARQLFTEAFGASPAVLARAPGRVELLGNHTDYNGGLVLAAAIDRFTAVVGRAVPGGRARVRSAGFEGAEEFAVDALTPGAEGSWGRYVRGVLWAFEDAGSPPRSGFEAAIAGDVPLGAGLSSSASVQAALALFLTATGVVDDPAGRAADEGGGLAPRLQLARLLRRGENAFVGVASGLLDQFTVLFGREGGAVLLDCRDETFERLTFGPRPPALVVCDSKTSRRLADGMYNRRRAECESVVEFFRRRPGGEDVQTLRDVTLDDLAASWDDLDPVSRLRARHVLTENARVRDGADALRRGDLAAFGRLMSASHASSRDDFGNSSPALDALIECAEASPGYLGGKLSGAGWAGCTINLVSADAADAFEASVTSLYSRRTGVAPDVHACRAADAAGVVPGPGMGSGSAERAGCSPAW